MLLVLKSNAEVRPPLGFGIDARPQLVVKVVNLARNANGDADAFLLP